MRTYYNQLPNEQTFLYIFFRCSLFIVQGEAGTDSHCLVSDLFDANINSTVEEMNNKTEIRIPWGSGFVGHVAASGVPVNITDCYADERFNPVSSSELLKRVVTITM